MEEEYEFTDDFETVMVRREVPSSSTEQQDAVSGAWEESVDEMRGMEELQPDGDGDEDTDDDSCSTSRKPADLTVNHLLNKERALLRRQAGDAQVKQAELTRMLRRSHQHNAELATAMMALQEEMAKQQPVDTDLRLSVLTLTLHYMKVARAQEVEALRAEVELLGSVKEENQLLRRQNDRLLSINEQLQAHNIAAATSFSHSLSSSSASSSSHNLLSPTSISSSTTASLRNSFNSTSTSTASGGRRTPIISTPPLKAIRATRRPVHGSSSSNNNNNNNNDDNDNNNTAGGGDGGTPARRSPVAATADVWLTIKPQLPAAATTTTRTPTKPTAPAPVPSATGSDKLSVMDRVRQQNNS